MSSLEEEDYSTRLDAGTWRKVFRRAMEQKGHVGSLAAVAVAIAFLDTMYPLVTQQVIDISTGSTTEAHQPLQNFIAYYAGITVLLVAGVCAFIYLAGRITTHMSHDVRRDAFARLQELSFSYFDRRPVGWLMSRVTSDCSRLSDFVAWGILDAVWALSLMSGIAVIMFIKEWRLALIVLTTMPVLAVISAYFKYLNLKSSRVMRKINAQMTASYNESIAGIRTSKTLVREDENLVEFQALSGGMFNASVKNAVQSALYIPAVVTLGSTALGLVLWYGGGITQIKGMSIGTLVMFMSYAGQFFDPVQQLAHVFTQMHRAQASGERIIDLLETEPEIKDSPAVLARKSADGARIEHIEFRNVTFAYKEGPTVLENFSLNVRAGQTIALVGPTGGGKSTIVSLLCRFYEPVSGEILIDGIDYRERGLHWLQSNLGMVLQTPHLFSGSVKENIRYGKLSATDDEIIHAAKLVNAHDFITAMEQGYDSPVGEGGSKLSTGQRQLVSFARAILANPQLFVMDEATSSVDTQTEQLIQKGLQKILKERISFVIAHRLSTIRAADVILVIEKGRIAERGTHHELILQRGHYHELYTNQFVREKEVELLAGQ